MEMLPVSPLDFDFHSTASSPYTTAPASPQPFGHSDHLFNLSAPTSPRQSSPINQFFREINWSRKSLSAVTFDWEAKPGVPKNRDMTGKSNIIRSLYIALLENEHVFPLSAKEIYGILQMTGTDDVRAVDDDFEFDFSGQLDVRVSASADELFDGGKIRPLKLPPRLQVVSGDDGSMSSTTYPRTRRSRFSPKKKSVQRKDFDPFTTALEETRKSEPPSQQRVSSALFFDLYSESLQYF